jgi:hypothetical protein
VTRELVVDKLTWDEQRVDNVLVFVIFILLNLSFLDPLSGIWHSMG